MTSAKKLQKEANELYNDPEITAYVNKKIKAPKWFNYWYDNLIPPSNNLKPAFACYKVLNTDMHTFISDPMLGQTSPCDLIPINLRDNPNGQKIKNRWRMYVMEHKIDLIKVIIHKCLSKAGIYENDSYYLADYVFQNAVFLILENINLLTELQCLSLFKSSGFDHEMLFPHHTTITDEKQFMTETYSSFLAFIMLTINVYEKRDSK